jgi:dienelactone hydrolase
MRGLDSCISFVQIYLAAASWLLYNGSMEKRNKVGKVVVRGLMVLVLVLALAVAGFVVWASQTNPILPAAELALQGASQQQGAGLVQLGAGILGPQNALVFRPTGQEPQVGYVFYPGGRVDYRAYAPYAQAVADQGFLVVVPEMPLNLAVLNSQAAGAVIPAYPEIRAWAVGGHSLGGSMAAQFAHANPQQVRGLVLLASYPAEGTDLSGYDVAVVSIYASEDGLATVEKVEESRPLLPPQTQWVMITGGNHAQFGDYGEQDGDGAATMDRAEQQTQAAAATAALLQRVLEVEK